MATTEISYGLLTTEEAAKYLTVSISLLEQARVLGTLKIPFVKIGKRVAYDVRDLDTWLAARKRTSTSAQPTTA